MLNSLCKKEGVAFPQHLRGRLLGSKLERAVVARQKGHPTRNGFGLALELALARNARHVGLHAGDEGAERLPNERTHSGRIQIPGGICPVIRFHALTGPNNKIIARHSDLQVSLEAPLPPV